MKIIKRILDNYFKNQFVNYVISIVKSRYALDSNIIEYKNGYVEIQFKPKYYKNFTTILSFHKGDSLNWLINLRESASNFIMSEIERIDEKQLWSKEAKK